MTFKNNSHFIPSASTVNYWLIVSLDLTTVNLSYKWNHTVFTFEEIDLLSIIWFCKIYAHWNLYQGFVHFEDRLIPMSAHTMPCIFVLSQWILELLAPWGIVNNTVMSANTQASLDLAFSSSGCVSRSQAASSYGNSVSKAFKSCYFAVYSWGAALHPVDLDSHQQSTRESFLSFSREVFFPCSLWELPKDV